MSNKKKERKKGNFSEESMKRAVTLVKEKNYSLRKAARETGLKHQTLARYVTKSKNADGGNLKRFKPNYEVRKVFNAEQESELVQYAKTSAAICFGLTTNDMRKMAFELAQKNDLYYPRPTQLEHK